MGPADMDMVRSFNPTCMSDIDSKVIALAPLGALRTRMAKFFQSSCFWH